MSQDFFVELQQEFLTESSFLLEQYEEAMLALESGNAADDVMALIFRVAHSIKGGAAAVGFADLGKFAHVVEDLLAILRVTPSLVNPAVVSLLLESGDVFKERISSLQAGEAGDWDVSELKERLQKTILTIGGTASEHLQASEVESTSDSNQGQAARNTGPINADDLFQFDPLPAVNPPLTTEASKDATADDCNHELLAELMASMGADSAEKPPQAVATAAPSVVLAPATSIAKPQAEKPGGSEGSSKAKTGMATGGAQIKVDIGRVDSVLDAVGEIVVLKNQLVHDELVRTGEHPRIAAIVDQLDKLVRELYDKTLSIRMTPLRSLFVKIQRIVRDVSLQLGKPVNLTLQGEETEVERTVFEILGDPLVHLVRNSMDHGIENPESRKAKGKPATAQVTVSARQVGGNVMIEITDDGGGISRERVLQKAIEKNLVPLGRDPESLRDEEVFQFIFAPGFSTAEKVTDLSGRGVGLDVVRSNLERVHGKIEIFSKKDIGTTFRLNIPLSTAITDGILVAAASDKYILPIHSIREIVRVVPSDYSQVPGHGRVVKIREVLMPVVESDRVFGAPKKQKAVATPEAEDTLRSRRGETMLVVIETMHGKTAFPVDDVLGQAQVVVKPVQAGSHVPEVAGAAILGDGKTVLILDPQALVASHRNDKKEKGAA